MNSFSEDGTFGQHDPAHPDAAAESGAGVAVAGPPAQLTPEQIRESLESKFVCPYCGSTNDSEQGICPRCSMENNPSTRKATKSRIGPWYVLQARNPAAPGMKFETLLNFAHKGRIKPRSVVRGPTTHQLWKFAAHVKGISREFGVCYSCGGQIEPAASVCPQCNRSQDPPANPDVLLETMDAPTPQPAMNRGGKFKEPDLAEVDAEFTVPALGSMSEDSVAGISMTGSMAGVAFNPDTWVPPRRDLPRTDSGRKPVDEGFLSPKDLAAAFNLNFTPNAGGADVNVPRPNPPARPRPVRPQRPAPAAVTRPTPVPRKSPVRSLTTEPDDLAAFQDSLPAPKSAPSKRPSRFRFIKALLFLVFFTLAIAAAAIYYDPTLKQQAEQWLASARSTVAQWQSSSNEAPATRKPSGTSTSVVKSVGAGSSRVSNATPAPTVNVQTPAAADPSPVSAVPAVPASVAIRPSTLVTPPPARPAAPATDPATASAQMLRLYRDALRLEGTDPAKAIAEYKSIKQLPREVWPTDLDLCIKRAQTHLQLPSGQ